MARLPDYLDRDGLVKYFPLLAHGDDTLTAVRAGDRRRGGLGDSRRIARAGWSSALRGFVEGRIVRDSPLPTADLTIRKIAALQRCARQGAAGRRGSTASRSSPICGRPRR